MAIGILFAILAALCGLALNRGLRVPLSLAPLSGLAAVVVLASWSTAVGLPPGWRSGLVSVLALGGLGVAIAAVLRARPALRARWLPLLLLALSVAIPALMLGFAFAAVEAPVSTHDGAFHVETIDKLRLGLRVEGWYPTGFHASVAAILGLVPWLDSARGTFEAAQGLALLAPLAAFALALALGMNAVIAASAAVILALTWTYPYDYHLWAGWPQGLGVLLLIGLCATALHWIERPSARLAVLGGLFAGAIVLNHGTEVYSAALALLVIAVARFRRLQAGPLARHVPLAIGLAVVFILPYLTTLLGWAGTGGATVAGEVVAAGPDVDGRGDVLQFILGTTGSASLIDLPVRVALMALGAFVFRARLAGGLWAAFVGLLLIVHLVGVPPVTTLFAVTYPWLDHDRPKQVIVIFASVLGAAGLWVCAGYVGSWRERFAAHPRMWARLAVVAVVLLGFFAEGSGVSIYKRLSQAIVEQNVYSADDAAAMAWLRMHAAAGEVVANDLAGDAGIWTPYKAGVAILLPRSATGSVMETREPILMNVANLELDQSLEGRACGLHVGYLFHGAPPAAFDERVYTDRAVLERSPGLEEVFASGEATVFKLNLRCS